MHCSLMTRAPKPHTSLLLSLAALTLPNAWAQSEAPQGLRQAEIYSTHDRLSGAFANWREIGFRGLYGAGQHLLAGEVATMQRFNEDGNYLALSDTLILDRHWYGSLAVGAGDGASYLPRYRIDGFIHRKWLDDLSLVTSAGLGHYKAPDSHKDDNLSLGLSWYLPSSWVLQTEAKFNRSRPGPIDTRQYFVAATWGQAGQTRITGRYGWGEEGYQSLGADAFISRFSSHQSTLTAQHWLGPRWGIKASADRYSNPFYKRHGLQLVVFKELP